MKHTVRTFAWITFLALSVSACAGGAEQDTGESINRSVFAFNEVVDSILLKPAAQVYRFVTPQPIRDRLGNAAANLNEPVTFVNSLLQGDVDNAFGSFFRFVINSTVGLAGLHDVAGSAGLQGRTEDFGQTLAVWGVDTGGYVVLPIIGPSTTRDTVGLVVDILVDPLDRLFDIRRRDEFIIRASQGLIKREQLLDPIDDVYGTSVDPYTSFRSIYLQRRENMIGNAKVDPRGLK
jgi:phospholipid-binding lipoprotein MlaA